MKQIRHSILGLPSGILVNVFTSAAELDAQSGVPNTCVDLANDNLLAWDIGAKARKAVCVELEKATGLVRKFYMGGKDGKVKMYSGKNAKGETGETEADYVKRVAATVANRGASLPGLILPKDAQPGKCIELVADALQAFVDALEVPTGEFKTVKNAKGEDEQVSITVRGVWTLDAREAEKKVREPRYTEKDIEDARKITATQKRADHWTKVFTDHKLVFPAFNLPVPAGASAEDAKKHTEAMVVNAAIAINANEKRELQAIKAAAELKRQKAYEV